MTDKTERAVTYYREHLARCIEEIVLLRDIMFQADSILVTAAPHDSVGTWKNRSHVDTYRLIELNKLIEKWKRSKKPLRPPQLNAKEKRVGGVEKEKENCTTTV